MRIVPPLVLDISGFLNIHDKQGVELLFDFSDEVGAPLSMVGRTVVFECSFTTIALTPGASDSQLKLVIPQGTLTNGIDKLTEFVILDTTDALDELLWEGKFLVRGLS